MSIEKNYIPAESEKIIKILNAVRILLDTSIKIDPNEDVVPSGVITKLEEIDDIIEECEDELGDYFSYDAG